MPAVKAACGDRANYRTFARMIRDFENGRLVFMTTADVSDRYRVSRRTVERWEIILQETFGLTTDKAGNWCEPKTATSCAQSAT